MFTNYLPMVNANNPTTLNIREIENRVFFLILPFANFRDLAVDLRLKLGDWFRVVQLLKTGGGGGK